MERLPVPIFRKDKDLITEIEMKTPGSGVLADTHDVLHKTGDEYIALHRMICGSLTRVGSIEDPSQIREVIKKIPYASGEFVSLKSLLAVAEDDGIDGIYPCTMGNCDGQHVAKIEIDSDGEEIMNNLDYLSEFEITYLQGVDGQNEEVTNTFRHDLVHPVEIMDGKQARETVTSLEFRYPTLQDCMSARSSMASGNNARMQMKIYANSIENVNGSEPAETLSKWKNRYASYVMDRLNVKHDLTAIYRAGRKWGYQTHKKRTCPQCGNVWSEKINPMGFFNSALRAVA